MTTGIFRSFYPNRDLIIVKVDGRSSVVALRVNGSDRSTMARMPIGHRISFDFACSRDGQVFVINVTPIPTLPTPRLNCRSDQEKHACGLDADDSDPDLAELLATPVIQRLMHKDGVDPTSIRRLVRRVVHWAKFPG